MLVLAVLAGILGMHALGPAPARAVAPTQPHHATAADHNRAAADHGRSTADHARATAERAGAGEDCAHPDDHGGSGHSPHADAACAAAGIATAYAPPALAESTAGLPAASPAHTADPAAATAARAPPDLAELQLLRI